MRERGVLEPSAGGQTVSDAGSGLGGWGGEMDFLRRRGDGVVGGGRQLHLQRFGVGNNRVIRDEGGMNNNTLIYMVLIFNRIILFWYS